MLRTTKISGILSLLLATPCFSGFYVGASVGPEGAHFVQKSHVTRANTFDVIDTNHFSGIGGFGSIFAGYELRRNKLYLAGELNANLSSLKYELTNDERIHQTFSKTTFTIKNSQSISILPGYFILDSTLLYGRVGYANGKLKIKESDPTIKNFDTNQRGLRLGLGIRQNLTSKLALRMEYSQIHYSKVHSRVFEPFGGVQKNTAITPYTAQVAFGVVYSFDSPGLKLTK